jgi:FMN hydrolase / 5-amino-6-(5-phospho-D-ribitylamino)uracil phosphatase
MISRIQAVTFDFFDTLVFHRGRSGRTRRLKEYLAAQGFQAPEWDDRSIYNVLDRHGTDYSPSLSHLERRRYLKHLAVRVFGEAGLPVTEDEAELHADAIWAVLGPSAFEVFADVVPTLRKLRQRGVRLAIISNWHCGLAHYVAELSLSRYFEHVIGSADVGIGKPDPRIFERAMELGESEPHETIYLGDNPEHDVGGAQAASITSVWVNRARREWPGGKPPDYEIDNLRQLFSLFEFPDAVPYLADC